MGDLLPILSGLIVVSALAVAVAGNDKKEVKNEKKRDDHKDKYKEKEKEKEKEKPKDELKKLFEYIGKNKTSSRKKVKRYHIARNKRGRSYRDSRGNRLRRLTSKNTSSK